MESMMLHALEAYENAVQSRQIATFSVCLKGNVMQVFTDGGKEVKQEIPLPPDLRNILDNFFQNVEAIPYLTYDYVTLKSLINAHERNDQMNNNQP